MADSKALQELTPEFLMLSARSVTDETQRAIVAQKKWGAIATPATELPLPLEFLSADRRVRGTGIGGGIQVNHA